MFIFGGMEKLKISNDMYCYNFVTHEWDKIIPRGNVPPPVFDHTCIYNCKNSMILFGGAHGKKDIFNKLNKDVYAFDLNTYQWSKVNVEGEIQPRYAHSASLYQNDKMIVFGGFFRENTNDETLYCLNLTKMKWSKMKQNGNIPEVRVYHSSVIYRNCMYVFGGLLIGLRPPKFSNELYEYNLHTNTWNIIESNISLPSRFMHSAVVHNDRMIIFGGSDNFTISNANNMRDKFMRNDSKNHAYAQLYEFIFPTKQWRKFSTHGDVPLLKKNHTAIIYKDAMWIFGGWIQNYMGDQSPFYELNIGKRIDNMVNVVPTDFFDIIFKLQS
jgi:N-acetylneuraminic acid mutarotase